MPFDSENYVGPVTAPEVQKPDAPTQAHPVLPSDILEAAAKLIERPGGWVKGRFRYGHSYCAVGAIQQAAESELVRMSNTPAFLRSLANAPLATNYAHAATPWWPFVGRNIIAYNDSLFRSAKQVAKVLRKAAARARADER